MCCGADTSRALKGEGNPQEHSFVCKAFDTSYQMLEFHDISYKLDGDKLNVFDIFVPPGVQKNESGLVCFVHGGAWQ